jgi:lipid-A-disaccharide synthase-like uncharacterized protein
MSLEEMVWHALEFMTRKENIWLAIGFAGQALFASRFLFQWLHSEKVGRSEIPLVFWFLSMGGGATLLAYAIYKLDPVFIMGQAGGLFVYARNLHLIYRPKKSQAEPGRPTV